MPTGRVKWYNVEKGYGFITQDSGEDVFFHRTGVKDAGFRSVLQTGDQVQFEIRQGPKGKQAINITRTS